MQVDCQVDDEGVDSENLFLHVLKLNNSNYSLILVLLHLQTKYNVIIICYKLYKKLCGQGRVQLGDLYACV